MKPHNIFRGLALLCLALIVVISVLYFRGYITDKLFAAISATVAILAAIFGAFGNRPVEKEDLALAVDRVLLTYDKDTISVLKEAKAEAENVRRFIDSKSNEIFLVKLRSYLVEEIKAKYENSEISRLVTDLVVVESQLDSLRVDYDPTKLPERFQRIIGELTEGERLQVYLRLFDSMPLLPFKRLFTAVFRAMYASRRSFRRLTE